MLRDAIQRESEISAYLHKSIFDSPQQRFMRNIMAVDTKHLIDFEQREPTERERQILGGFTGWQGLAGAFEEANEDWELEFIQAYTTLSPEEYATAKKEAEDSVSGRQKR